MARTKSETLTPREAEIIEILRRQGRATADQIPSAMADQPHDSTVRTLHRVLELAIAVYGVGVSFLLIRLVVGLAAGTPGGGRRER